MPKGMDIINQEFDKEGEDAKKSRVNKPHAVEHKPHVSADNSTSQHKPKSVAPGNLGFRPAN